jgi:hypothetical protein
MFGPLHLAFSRAENRNVRYETDRRRIGRLKQKQRKIRLEARPQNVGPQ